MSKRNLTTEMRVRKIGKWFAAIIFLVSLVAFVRRPSIEMVTTGLSAVQSFLDRLLSDHPKT
jgi:hypothetical protein